MHKVPQILHNKSCSSWALQRKDVSNSLHLLLTHRPSKISQWSFICHRITAEPSEISSFPSLMVFVSFFPHFLLSYFECFSDCTEHISLISYQIPSVGLSFHPPFTILTSSASLDRLNICSRRKTRVYVSLAYAGTITIR